MRELRREREEGRRTDLLDVEVAKTKIVRKKRECSEKQRAGWEYLPNVV